MQLDPRTMKQESTYKLLIGCVKRPNENYKG
jgi:hypothetical protein